MGPLMWVADATGRDLFAVTDFTLDHAEGTGKGAECDFELSFASDAAGRRRTLSGGELAYLEGTCVGGVVDSVQSAGGTMTYRGRTWGGVLAHKVIDPGDGHVRVSGEANAVVADVLSRCALSGLMAASKASGGLTVPTTDLERFCTAWEGLWQALSAAGARLSMARWQGGPVTLSAVPRATRELAGELVSLDVTRARSVTNHLVCAGEGKGGERVRVDLYADATGAVSETQTLFGADEVAERYSFTSADRALLVEDGTRRLRGHQALSSAKVTLPDGGGLELGDVVRARDEATGLVAEATVSKRVTKVRGGVMTVSWEASGATVS